jgi:glycosyltransferase involved in cell wall biosynthesis
MRVLELRSVRGTGGGPEKTILLSASQHDPSVVAATVCYIRDVRDRAFKIDAVAGRLGIDYVEVLERHSFDWRIWSELKRLILERRIDIIHGHEYKTDLLALLLARTTGTIAIATAHGWSGDTRREWFYYWADKKLLARYPLVIAVSESIRQVLLAHGADPRRVRRVLNGVDHHVFRRVPGMRATARAALGLSSEAIVIGAVGRLEPEKGFERLLAAAAALGPDLNAHVVIAGDGSQRTALIERGRQLGIAERVHLLGHCDDVLSVHHLFDIYVQTSVREGIPNAVLEAMAVGTPIVATDVGGTSELITNGIHGLLVPAADDAALAEALRVTLAQRDAAASRTNAARQRVESELSFSARLRAVERIYAELLDANQSPGTAPSTANAT